jgi:hypothetical protein
MDGLELLGFKGATPPAAGLLRSGRSLLNSKNIGLSNLFRYSFLLALPPFENNIFFKMVKSKTVFIELHPYLLFTQKNLPVTRGEVSVIYGRDNLYLRFNFSIGLFPPGETGGEVVINGLGFLDLRLRRVFGGVIEHEPGGVSFAPG